MRFIPSEKIRELRKEIEPYLIIGLDGVTYKEETPDEIKEKHQLWSKLYHEEQKMAEEFCG